MGSTSWSVRRVALFVTAVAGVCFGPAAAWAMGETITDVRVLDNQRTDESTVRSIAGISIGDTMEQDTLERVRERLHTAGLFADVNVWWEQHGEGVRVNVAVKDKFPWAPVPTASWSANNRSFGLVFVHGNLFGRGKQLLIGGRIADIDSGAVLAYRDPSLFNSWLYWQLSGSVQRQVVPEYDPGLDNPDTALRETHMTALGVETTVGIAWFRRVRTQIAWAMQKYNVSSADRPEFNDMPQVDGLVPAAQGATVGIGRASISFDFRAREFAVMTGTAMGGGVDLASPTFGGTLDYWRATAGFEHGTRFFKSHNFIYSGYAGTGHNLPFWNEFTGGGPNLRGYLFQQFRGDSQVSGKIEYHFPLFSIGSLDFRALGFYDVAAVWFRDLPPEMNRQLDGSLLRLTGDRRDYLMKTTAGFSADRDIHNDVGGGLRFFLRSVAIPLVGFDAGYGLEAKTWRFTLVIGA